MRVQNQLLTRSPVRRRLDSVHASADLVLFFIVLLSSQGALAQSRYLVADVVSVVPVYQNVLVKQPQQVCYEEQQPRRNPRGESKTPGIVGGILGGAIGNAVGNNKSSKKVGTVVGGVLGYSIAQDITRSRRNQGGYTDVTYREVCEVQYETQQQQRLMGYDVSYSYAGQTYHTRLDRDPGQTLRVRVRVNPV